MEVHPPWASELLARNRKVARSMVWSTSFDSGLSAHSCPANKATTREQETGRSFNSSKDFISGSPTGIMKITTRDDRGKVVELNRIASRNVVSEKSVNIQRDGGADEEVGYNQDNMKEKNGEESFLEYGPGIVRKLRSRYQSLALRHSSGRPSLRRSTSLENVLDAPSVTLQTSSTPSPVPYNDEVFESSQHDIEQRVEVNYVKNGIVTVGESYGSRYVNRSRQGYGDYNRKDRMRRARSVDALHRGSKREEEEREIFEKFKTVVLPKEEIVIIEVSKPRANLSSDIYKCYGIEDKLDSSSSPYGNANATQQSHTRSFATPHTLSMPSANGQYPSELTRVRSLASPEHELPPPDIVRETARIFEKNTDNTQSVSANNLSPNNLSINNFKKVGHALRLNKSSSVSPNSSPLPSPTAPNAKTIMNGGQNLNGISYHLGQNKSHLLQSSATAHKSHESSSITNGISKPSVPSPKQVGVIRPTVASATSNPGLPGHAKSNPAPKAPIPVARKVPVPEVSPILKTSDRNQVTDNKPFPQTRKPPLSPKPIYTSSPKNIFLLQNSKNVTSATKLTESVQGNVENSSVTKASEDETVKMEDSENKAAPGTTSFSPSSIIAQTRVNGSSGVAPKNNKPSEKENKSVMEFQQIALKPVAKPDPSDNVVISNNLKNTNNSSNPVNSTSTLTTEVKTERKQDVKDVSAKPQIIASTMKAQPSPAPRKSAAPAVTAAVAKTQDPQPQSLSDLRSHQKQVSEKKKQTSTNGAMVFNFTKRSTVPDYIEDDGLHRRVTVSGTVTDESHDDDFVGESDHVDSKLIHFEGGNIIINGRSSIQKKPKSQKLNISINEDATTTFEYPSEISMLSADDSPPTENILTNKTPNITTGSELGNYTSSKLGSTYQLGSYETKKIIPPAPLKKQEETEEYIEDYLKPDKESTTWSNEIGADILF